jgi:hypothetical protein
MEHKIFGRALTPLPLRKRALTYDLDLDLDLGSDSCAEFIPLWKILYLLIAVLIISK